MINYHHAQAPKPRARFINGHWFVRFPGETHGLSHISGDMDKSLALVHRRRIEREQIAGKRTAA